jgi:hypothetical protein
MNCYKADNEGTLIELGDLLEDEAVELLRIHREDEGKNELFIGANRSNNDFVEIGYLGREEFGIHTDKLSRPPGFFKSLFSQSNIDITVKGIEEAETILRAYYSKPRDAFEAYLEKLKKAKKGTRGNRSLFNKLCN